MFFVFFLLLGREICSQPDQHPCGNTRYPIYCIAKDLVCDGKRNCPFEGSDEDKELCSNGGHSGKHGIGKPAAENSHTQNWEFIAAEFIKKLSSKEHGSLKNKDPTSSTEKSTVLWSDEGNMGEYLKSFSERLEKSRDERKVKTKRGQMGKEKTKIETNQTRCEGQGQARQ